MKNFRIVTACSINGHHAGFYPGKRAFRFFCKFYLLFTDFQRFHVVTHNLQLFLQFKEFPARTDKYDYATMFECWQKKTAGLAPTKYTSCEWGPCLPGRFGWTGFWYCYQLHVAPHQVHKVCCEGKKIERQSICFAQMCGSFCLVLDSRRQPMTLKTHAAITEVCTSISLTAQFNRWQFYFLLVIN